MTPDIEQLLDAAQGCEPKATRELVAMVRAALRRPDRRVGSVFMPKGRGGEPDWRAAQRAERDETLRALARLLHQDEMPIEQQAREVIRKADLYLANGWLHDQRRAPAEDESAERALLRKLGKSGLPVPRLRQMKKIIAGLSDF